VRAAEARSERAAALAPLLSAVAVLLPAASVSRPCAASHAAAAAAVEACRCLTLVLSRGQPREAIMRSALTEASLQARCDVAAAFAVALCSDSHALVAVRCAACSALAALLPSAPIAAVLLLDASGDDEKLAPAGLSEATIEARVGATIAVGLLSASRHAACASAAPERAPLAAQSPNRASRHAQDASRLQDLLQVPGSRSGMASACHAALRSLLAFSSSAKEHVLARDLHQSWVDATVRDCETLASGLESEVRRVHGRFCMHNLH
jgi:hypothetical protein